MATRTIELHFRPEPIQIKSSEVRRWLMRFPTDTVEVETTSQVNYNSLKDDLKGLYDITEAVIQNPREPVPKYTLHVRNK